jgi:hypothetical protein
MYKLVALHCFSLVEAKAHKNLTHTFAVMICKHYLDS